MLPFSVSTESLPDCGGVVLGSRAIVSVALNVTVPWLACVGTCVTVGILVENGMLSASGSAEAEIEVEGPELLITTAVVTAAEVGAAAVGAGPQTVPKSVSVCEDKNRRVEIEVTKTTVVLPGQWLSALNIFYKGCLQRTWNRFGPKLYCGWPKLS